MRLLLPASLLALLTLPAAAQTTPDWLAPARRHQLRHDYAAASASYRRVLPRHGGRARDYYQAARAAARNHEGPRALGWLTQAINKGYYDAGQIRTEPDFATLAAQPGWLPLLARARARQQQHEQHFDQPLVALLKKTYYQDQHYRLVANAAEQRYGLNAPQMIEAMHQQTLIDLRLSRQADSLIARHGYPGKSLVGEYQKNVVFFVIQHSPDARYLPLLTAAANKGEMSWSALALFIDRLKTERGEKQVYGSQFGGQANGHYTLQPIADEFNVNVRRAKVGLGPLEEYLLLYGLTYRVPTATHNPNPPALYAMAATSPAAEHSPVELIGGYEALKAQLRYPAEAQAQQVRGSVTLELLIDAAGVPQEVVVVKGLGYGCDEEAMRVMRAARYHNSTGQTREIRLSLPFPYSPAQTQ